MMTRNKELKAIVDRMFYFANQKMTATPPTIEKWAREIEQCTGIKIGWITGESND
jgi:hypothetical protein